MEGRAPLASVSTILKIAESKQQWNNTMEYFPHPCLMLKHQARTCWNASKICFDSCSFMFIFALEGQNS
jgi:hypothetical protein